MKNAVAMIARPLVVLAVTFCSVSPAAAPPGSRLLAIEAQAAQSPGTAVEALPTLDSILQRYIEALGGKEAIENIHSRNLMGELTHDYPGENPPRTVLPAEAIAAATDKWRLILKTSAGVQQMGFDGERGWTQDADRILIDSRQARSRLAFLFHPGAPLRLKDYFSQLSLQGEVVREGRREYAVKAIGASGTPETLFFDAETGLLNRLGENIVVKSYRRMQGVLHPVHIAIARRGGTSTYRFTDIAVGIDIDDPRFAVPTMGEVFAEVFEGLADPAVVPLLKDFPSVHEDMNVPCRDGRFLHDLIVRNGYKRGLEIGSFTGYSALWMGLAFKTTGGRLVTIEFEAPSGLEAQKNIRRAGLESVVDARIADAFVEIPKIAGDFDFVFIDAWKPDYVKFLNLVRGRVVPGGAIIGHNVTNYARDMQDYLAAIRKDSGLETTFHELSAEGMSVSIVRSTSPSSAPFGCTIVMATRNGLVLVGNNEDRNHPGTIVTFVPVTEKYYGRVVFGYDDAPVQGGMNDQGLFIDANALAPTGWKPEPNKPTFRGNVMMVILGTCATCEDVQAFFEKSNFPALDRARFPVADRSGASMVVEYSQGRVQFVRSDTWYQIATNFVMSNVKAGNYPCWRYRAADKIMSGAKKLNVELIRDVLAKTHQEAGSLTVYSNIYDLNKGTIYVYNLRNFDEVVVLNLAEELKKGQRRLELPSLFKSPPRSGVF